MQSKDHTYSTWYPHTWDGINCYYRDVHYQCKQIKGN